MEQFFAFAVKFFTQHRESLVALVQMVPTVVEDIQKLADAVQEICAELRASGAHVPTSPIPTPNSVNR